MTDRYERIRDALKMEPTPGPWVVDRLSGSGRLQVNAPSSHTVATICHNVYIPEEVHAANARLIAACDPDTIRELLAERDQLAAALEAAQMGLRYAVRVWVLSDDIVWSEEKIDEVVESIIGDAKKEAGND